MWLIKRTTACSTCLRLVFNFIPQTICVHKKLISNILEAVGLVELPFKLPSYYFFFASVSCESQSFFLQCRLWKGNLHTIFFRRIVKFYVGLCLRKCRLRDYFMLFLFYESDSHSRGFLITDIHFNQAANWTLHNKLKKHK